MNIRVTSGTRQFIPVRVEFATTTSRESIHFLETLRAWINKSSRIEYIPYPFSEMSEEDMSKLVLDIENNLKEQKLIS